VFPLSVQFEVSNEHVTGSHINVPEPMPIIEHVWPPRFIGLHGFVIDPQAGRSDLSDELAPFVDAPTGSVESAERPPEQAAARNSKTLKTQMLGRAAREEDSI
jgi:hypothetical protein